MIRKKQVREIDRAKLEEPSLSESERNRYFHGIELFDAGKFWEAHEAWEEVWKERPEESRIFFQGIIQTAAAYHLLIVKRRYVGMMNNFDKALSKLELFSDHFLQIDLASLRRAIRKSQDLAKRLGSEKLGEFPKDLLPTIHTKRS